MKTLLAFFLLCSAAVCAQSTRPTEDPLAPLAFLQGTWQANNVHGGSGGEGSGDYTFARELRGHVLARHGSYANCKGPQDFDCAHQDLLYVYADAASQSLKAIFFDNEGHVIHYGVSTPDAATAVFLSDSSAPGPQFRLTYSLKGTIMSGKFEIKMPGQSEWRSYLEWSGAKKEK
jgi:hypothetical protein